MKNDTDAFILCSPLYCPQPGLPRKQQRSKFFTCPFTRYALGDWIKTGGGTSQVVIWLLGWELSQTPLLTCKHLPPPNRFYKHEWIMCLFLISITKVPRFGEIQVCFLTDFPNLRQWRKLCLKFFFSLLNRSSDYTFAFPKHLLYTLFLPLVGLDHLLTACFSCATTSHY